MKHADNRLVRSLDIAQGRARDTAPIDKWLVHEAERNVGQNVDELKRWR